MQKSHSQSIKDLKQLTSTAETKLNQLYKQVRSLPTAQQLISSSDNQKIGKSFAKVQDSIKKLFKYSEHLAGYFDQIAKEKDQLKKRWEKSQKQLVIVASRCHLLEQESMLCRKQLNKKDQEIQKLKNLLQINATFIQSSAIYSPDNNFSVSSVVDDEQSSSSLCQQQLNYYDSFTKDLRTTSKKQQMIKADQSDLVENLERSDCLTRSSEEHCISNSSSTDRFLENLENLLLELDKFSQNSRTKSSGNAIIERQTKSKE